MLPSVDAETAAVWSKVARVEMVGADERIGRRSERLFPGKQRTGYDKEQEGNWPRERCGAELSRPACGGGGNKGTSGSGYSQSARNGAYIDTVG